MDKLSKQVSQLSKYEADLKRKDLKAIAKQQLYIQSKLIEETKILTPKNK
ncbi:hypothetical protein ABC345_02465 [Shouchella sp. 1P09AA]